VGSPGNVLGFREVSTLTSHLAAKDAVSKLERRHTTANTSAAELMTSGVLEAHPRPTGREHRGAPMPIHAPPPAYRHTRPAGFVALSQACHTSKGGDDVAGFARSRNTVDVDHSP
jgi:hypothetical protein